MVKYTVNGTTVRCIITTRETFNQPKSYIGIAKLNPEDKFDLETGKQIAYKRALLKVKKSDLAFANFNLEMTQRAFDLHVKNRWNSIKIKNQIKSITRELNALTGQLPDKPKEDVTDLLRKINMITSEDEATIFVTDLLQNILNDVQG